jgi:acetylornithine deacetylase
VARLSDPYLLARLVALNTAHPNGNLPVIDVLCDYLDRPGVRLHRLPAPEGARANLLVEVGPEPTGNREGLLLVGHTDVVPAGEPGWETDPFRLSVRGANLHGRGAADMKGFVAIAANLVAERDPASLRAPLALLFTYDEEIGTRGARRFAESWSERERLPLQAIVGEPTRLEVVRAHKGIVELRITVTGQSAHSGYPHLGRSAIEPLAAVVSALATLRRELERERGDASAWFPEVPFVPLNVGTLRGGVAPNVIPERAVAEVTVRPLPGMEVAPLVARVRDVVSRAAGTASWTMEVVSESPPMQTAADAPLIGTLLEVTGQRETQTVSYATDAGWLQTLGLECAIFGPGDIATAHRPNEYVALAELTRAREVLRRVIERFCGGVVDASLPSTP